MNPNLQEAYLDRFRFFVENNLNSEEAGRFMVSFWRTVVIRSHREIALTLLGRYKNPVNFKYSESNGSENIKAQFYDRFIESHRGIIKRGVGNLEILLSN